MNQSHILYPGDTTRSLPSTNSPFKEKDSYYNGIMTVFEIREHGGVGGD